MKALEELGKHFLNVALAFLVAGVITPLAQGKFNIELAILFFLLWLIFVITGTILIGKGKGDGN